MDKPIKVLQVTIGDGNYGGIAAFLFTYYKHLDHSKVHFDFLYCGENSMESKANSVVLADSTITTLHILKRNNNGLGEYKRLFRRLREFFSENEYDIVHINSSNLFLNFCVEKVIDNRTVCISHSHNTKSTIEYSGKLKSFMKELLRKPCRKYVIKHSDYLFACSEMAGEYLFGKKIKSNPKFKVIHNAIDINYYAFDLGKRNLNRCTEDIVVGFVGRLADQKNPLFLLDIFEKLHRKNEHTILWVIGDGELKEKVEEKIESMKLNTCVKLFGARNDVPDLMQGMDLLLIPSLYEGLSIVAIEAQASGLPVYASNAVPSEANITGLIHYLSLSASSEEWAQTIQLKINGGYDRLDNLDKIIAAGYDIDSAAKWLEKFYLDSRRK